MMLLFSVNILYSHSILHLLFNIPLDLRPFNPDESYLDEVIGYPLALLGFYFQAFTMSSVTDLPNKFPNQLRHSNLSQTQPHPWEPTKVAWTKQTNQMRKTNILYLHLLDSLCGGEMTHYFGVLPFPLDWLLWPLSFIEGLLEIQVSDFGAFGNAFSKTVGGGMIFWMLLTVPLLEQLW